MRVDYRPETLGFEVNGTITLPTKLVTQEFVELTLADGLGEPEFTLADAPGSKLRVTKKIRPPQGRPSWKTNTWRIQLPRPHPAGAPLPIGVRFGAKGEVAANVFFSGKVWHLAPASPRRGTRKSNASRPGKTESSGR
jgi:hypothetical protein